MGGSSARRSVAVAVATAMALASAVPANAEHGDWDDPAAAIATGRSSNGLALGGTFTARESVVDASGHLVVNGILSGALTAPGTLQTPIDVPAGVRVDWAQTTANCHMLNLALGPADPSPSVHMDQTRLTITMTEGPGSRLRVPLCRVADLLRRPRANDVEVGGALNEILGLVHGSA